MVGFVETFASSIRNPLTRALVASLRRRGAASASKPPRWI